MTPGFIFGLCAAGSVLLALALWFEVRRTTRALPRMVLTIGVVRELETVLVNREAGSVRSSTLVQVDFLVEGKPYCCRTLQLFAGNRHVGDVRKQFNLSPGQEVGVYYDPADPRRSALILDRPRHDSAVFALGVGVVFAILAVLRLT